MPTAYSIWICNFPVPFCRDFHEQQALFRNSDVINPLPLTIYPKKKYIIIDLTKYVPTGMIDKDEFNTCMSFARREGYEEGEAKGEARAKRKFAARDKKIAEYFRSIGVPKKTHRNNYGHQVTFYLTKLPLSTIS